MIVLDFLRENPVSALEQRGIYARWSTQNPRKLSLNYDQIEAKDGNPLTEHCRGLVLRQDHDGPKGGPGKYSILARPFRRFYNLGQEAAASIDWATARYETKTPMFWAVAREKDQDIGHVARMTELHLSFHAAIEAYRKEGVFMPSLVERVARDACGVS